ncbi:hypothetical protein SUGI_1496540 [Cryptomeria japonica]|uniref:Transmembrane protein 177 n=1 Tax=Cryptomeria japonica TaxID=3369 RepID=A0AAD3NTY0_CRYJA|nr:hypothetical protein SUGI_1496540 [Cryptomeria japonica]
MFNYLAKVGRKPWSQAIVPLVAGVSATGYIGVHMFGHQVVRNLFIAQTPDGTLDQLSPDLCELIKKVYHEISPVYNIPTMKVASYVPPKATITWFCTSLMDPINLGMTENRKGVLIGLPSYYNYTKPEDVPSSVFQFRKVSLFKMPKKQEKNEQIDAQDLLDREQCPPGELIPVDLNSPAAKDYINSLVLSDEAKMFSVARELFMGDSYRPLAKSGLIFGSITFSVQLSRAVVIILRLREAHITQRMAMYMMSAVAGFVCYALLGDMIEQYFVRKADEKAMSVSSTYRQGAKEYFNKIMQRNRALRDLSETFQVVYDKDGEVVEPLLRFKHMPLKDRLKFAEEPDEGETKS